VWRARGATTDALELTPAAAETAKDILLCVNASAVVGARRAGHGELHGRDVRAGMSA
jgi:hypothetical protein